LASSASVCPVCAAAGCMHAITKQKRRKFFSFKDL
jgi:hypothetical protein